jgi:ketosteroid isomerase-like protein
MSPSHPDPVVEQDIRRAQQQFWEALQNKDRARFEQVVAEEFVGRSPGQPNEDRAAFIHTLASFPARVLSVDVDGLEIHRFGEVAILTGVQVAQLQLPNGARAASRVMLTNVFRQSADGWRMVFSHAADLPVAD